MPTTHRNILELFNTICKKYPYRPAIKDARMELSYSQLFNIAKNAALKLKHFEVKTGDKVVCLARKNNHTVIAFWTILLSGAIPVILDGEEDIHINEAKINFISPKAVLYDTSEVKLIPSQSSALCINVNTLFDESATQTTPDLPCIENIPECCYILLTSGTTGIPKAVQISHKNVLHYINALTKELTFTTDVRAGHVTSFSADLGLTNLLIALITGGLLRIFNKKESSDPELFHSILKNEQINFLKTTPSHFISLKSGYVETSHHIFDNLILGGERLSWSTVNNILVNGHCHNLYNHYGPTETTIGATLFKVETSHSSANSLASVPIGTALGKGVCFIKDSVENVGELYISGPGVSMGYFANDIENASRFVNLEVNGKIERCYRTGDICRELSDGNFVFLYRKDRQVKIRGYRIELGEIEMAISSFPDVENVNVTISEQDEYPILNAFIKTTGKNKLNAGDISIELSKKISSYKIPSNIYIYDEIPVTANGKVDLRMLEINSKSQSAVTINSLLYRQNSWQAHAQSAWKTLLKKEQINESDNFFHTGGDSLLAIQLIGKLQRLRYKIHINDLNANPIFGNFIALEPILLETSDVSYDDHGQHYLTYSQSSFLKKTWVNKNYYCQTLLFETEDKLKLNEFAMAVNLVFNNHARLNRPFIKSIQKKHYFKTKDIGVTVLNNYDPTSFQIQETSRQILKTISIKDLNLFQVHLFIGPNSKEYILFAAHHLCVDVLSWNILLNEVLEYYTDLMDKNVPKVTPENSIHVYHDNQPTGFDVIYEPIIRLTSFRSIRPNGEALLQSSVITFSPEFSTALQFNCTDSKSISIDGLLLSEFHHSLLDVLNIPEITIDVEFHGRDLGKDASDTARSVGWWANSLPVNLNRGINSPEAVTAILTAKSTHSVEINKNKLLTDISKTELSDIRFNYLGQFPETFKSAYLNLSPSQFNTGPTRHKEALREYCLNFTGRFIGSILTIDIQYSPQIILSDEICKLANYFATRLKKYVSGTTDLNITKYYSLSEVNLPTIGQPLINLQINRDYSPEKTKTVFLTGATGFLGIHVLNSLIKLNRLNLYCLVRGTSEANAVERLNKTYCHYFNSSEADEIKHIIVLKGDLLSECFGLDPDIYRKLIIEIDTIIHAAADVNLTKNYLSLKESNVTSVKKILEFASSGNKKKVNYISTLSVSGRSTLDKTSYFSEKDFDINQDFLSDYERTKFDAEKEIMLFNSHAGSAKIFRIGHLAADSVFGRFQKNIEQNRIFQVIKGIMTLKYMPDNYHELVSFSYVDIVANVISCFSINDSENEMVCMHVQNPYNLTFIEIAEHLKKMGYKISIVKMSEFKKIIKDYQGTNFQRKTVDIANLWIQRYINLPKRIKYTQADSIDAMAKRGLYFRETTHKWFTSMIQEGIKCGYFISPDTARLNKVTTKFKRSN